MQSLTNKWKERITYEINKYKKKRENELRKCVEIFTRVARECANKLVEINCNGIRLTRWQDLILGLSKLQELTASTFLQFAHQ